jgi:hypothetical protein
MSICWQGGKVWASGFCFWFCFDIFLLLFGLGDVRTGGTHEVIAAVADSKVVKFLKGNAALALAMKRQRSRHVEGREEARGRWRRAVCDFNAGCVLVVRYDNRLLLSALHHRHKQQTRVNQWIQCSSNPAAEGKVCGHPKCSQ